MSEHEDSLLFRQRHTLAHVLAEAVQRVQQRDVEVAIGPAIDNGLYYDFLFSPEKQIWEEDLKKVQDQMEKIVKEWQELIRIDVSAEDSDYLVNTLMKQKYKDEMRREFLAAGETISFYVNTIVEAAKDRVLQWVDENYIKYYEWITEYLQQKYPDKFTGKFATFLDMCEWPHVESTKEIDPKSFKIDKLAWAYWRWNSNNVMMTRIYVWAFSNKDELKEYVEMMEEAKKRDHRKLGKDLDLFFFDDLTGKWLPMYLPRGYIVYHLLEEYIREKETKLWYLHVMTPCLWNVDLYRTSGHLDHYQEWMFPIMEREWEEFVLRPMNCPHHMMIYANQLHSYKDLPIRIGEIAHDFRFESSGTLKWIERSRHFCQNDAHLFVTPEQMKDEFKKVVNLIFDVYKDFGIENYRCVLSLRDPEDKVKYHPDDAMREKAENSLREVLNEMGLEYTEEIWEAAFYGPKLDVNVKPAIWNEYTLSTCQLDFCLPAKFDLKYTDKDGEKKTPIVLHRAILWAIGRFFAYIIEETKWVFPTWLAPEQVRIIPVADAFNDYANKVCEELRAHDFRASVDEWWDSFNKKIRNAELLKIPYILIVWEKEVWANTVSVREFVSKEQYTLKLNEFVDKLAEIVKSKK